MSQGRFQAAGQGFWSKEANQVFGLLPPEPVRQKNPDMGAVS
jgi:hypothetical protein